MMTRQQMIDKVVRMYGLEHKYTILFCELAEVLPEDELLTLLITIEGLYKEECNRD